MFAVREVSYHAHSRNCTTVKKRWFHNFQMPAKDSKPVCSMEGKLDITHALSFDLANVRVQVA